MQSTPPRSVDWLGATSRSLRSVIPAAAESADLVTERLSALLLETLPPKLGRSLIRLLPGLPQMPNSSSRFILKIYAESEADDSIGFSDFVEGTHHALGLSDLLDTPEYAESEDCYNDLCTKVTETFLWLVANDLPPELKSKMREHLPPDLLSRMNLYSGGADESRVA